MGDDDWDLWQEEAAVERREFSLKRFSEMWEKNPGGSIGKCQTRPTNPFLFCWVCGTSASVFSIQLMLLMSDVARKIRPSNFVEVLLANAQLHSI
jgi:hypothetical protein